MANGRLAEPGGYLQWEESRRDTSLVKGGASDQFEPLYDEIWAKGGISFEWIRDLPQRLEKMGLTVLDAKDRPYKKSVQWLEGINYVMSFRGVLNEMRKVQSDSSSASDVEQLLSQLHIEGKHRNIFPWTAVAVLAQSPA
ncbi:hypothetical protein PENSOL_c018G04906 [Penicillium solitum]|uniref:Methyltransferase type 11 domain-containing protein n=1 Tax=Penicillium solitum TaxID=60172 RepID=A0A1V6R338_9EURO|nr:uncharacterized protein PENSOL_c018G04906 [Penicillium solitum]OQD95863.1 hypothetical protein PENSOL_c018G04906 [Penicillium solitum]